MAAVAVSSAKRSLRAELKQRLRAMSAEERLRQSRLLAQKVMAHSRYQKSERISIFLSMQDEIETEEIIKDIFRRGKTCFIPRYQLQSNHMDMVKLASPEEVSSLPRTSWNIHQPGEDEVREEALSTGWEKATRKWSPARPAWNTASFSVTASLTWSPPSETPSPGAPSRSGAGKGCGHPLGGMAQATELAGAGARMMIQVGISTCLEHAVYTLS
ncbi:5-formyltetrahydrofolate cyclo-ligase isoform X2 [Phoca vitulina]|uniref:5-formyltetrahydrofolate cyclo-ligase isoform X2 n=1 Tax=Phoca vitulina TaxID=9720 RepID=UPI001395EC09|nr:5-formyltetrahydrofolate cyclo-ligase isoform X2 [Phoca vitulina]